MPEEPGGSEHDYSVPERIPTAGLEVRCVRCGYSLRGLAIRQLCPECGTPVWTSMTSHRTSGLAIASMVLGIISIPTCMAYGVPSLVCGILAIVFARKGEGQVSAGQASPSSLGMAKAGRICGWVGVCLSVAFWGLLLLFLIGSAFY